MKGNKAQGQEEANERGGEKRRSIISVSQDMVYDLCHLMRGCRSEIMSIIPEYNRENV